MTPEFFSSLNRSMILCTTAHTQTPQSSNSHSYTSFTCTETMKYLFSTISGCRTFHLHLSFICLQLDFQMDFKETLAHYSEKRPWTVWISLWNTNWIKALTFSPLHIRYNEQIYPLFPCAFFPLQTAGNIPR